MGNSTSMPKITKRDRAILESRDKIRQYQIKIQHVLDREQEAAKACLRAGQKDRALLALRRRKYQETLLLKTDTQLENLEGLVSTIEFSLVEMSVLHGLQQGNAVLADIHKEMNIESVEKLLGETQEAIAYQQEINDMLANSMTADDEDAVIRELAQMQAEQLRAQEPPEPAVVLPTVPQQEPADRESREASPVADRTRVALEA
ncbi:Snf7 family [Hysterangium stoloniferum]|nr:Snf7 family [Hysterangium stoloniferum]